MRLTFTPYDLRSSGIGRFARDGAPIGETTVDGAHLDGAVTLGSDRWTIGRDPTDGAVVVQTLDGVPVMQAVREGSTAWRIDWAGGGATLQMRGIVRRLFDLRTDDGRDVPVEAPLKLVPVYAVEAPDDWPLLRAAVVLLLVSATIDANRAASSRGSYRA